MGNWFSKKSTLKDVKNNICTSEEPALRNILKLVETSENSLSIRDLYLKSIEYVECGSSNATLLRDEIYTIYQNTIIEEALKLMEGYQDWELVGTTDEEKLSNIQDRMIDLQKDLIELTNALKYYTRDDSQAADILEVLQELQNDTLSQLKVLSEAVDVFKARYLFGTILCNYCCGDIGNANKEAELKIINNYLTLNSYKGCLLFSEFQPLLWPTDFDWNDNNTSQKGISDEFLESYIESGIPAENIANMSSYYSNYYWPKYTDLNKLEELESFEDMANKIKPFVENKNIKTWKIFFNEGKKVLEKFDVHHFKMMPYMAHKKHFLSEGEFMNMPITYPKYDRDIEIFEAIISVANVCFNSCGLTLSKPDGSKILGGYTYKDLGLNKYYSIYFDKRPFVVNNFTTLENQTSELVTCDNIDTNNWKDIKLELSADKDDEPGLNNTSYFTDRVFNCLDNSKDDRFPYIDNLSAFRKEETFEGAKRVKAEGSDIINIIPDEEIKAEETILKEMGIKPEANKAETFKIYKELFAESFTDGLSNHLIISKSNLKGYKINTIVIDYYKTIIGLITTKTLYASKNNKLYSSIDYITTDNDKYSENPAITYYIYYNLVPKSLDFEIDIPLNVTGSTMSICTNDMIGGCEEKYLIPFVFSQVINNKGLIDDPLFNNYDFDLDEEDEEYEEDDEEDSENEKQNKNIENFVKNKMYYMLHRNH